MKRISDQDRIDILQARKQALEGKIGRIPKVDKPNKENYYITNESGERVLDETRFNTDRDKYNNYYGEVLALQDELDYTNDELRILLKFAKKSQ